MSNPICLIEKYRDNPIRFIKELILTPDQKMTKLQIKICEAFENDKKLFVSTVHGVGKK